MKTFNNRKENALMTRTPTIGKSDSPHSDQPESEMIGLKLNKAQRELILQRTSLSDEEVGRLETVVSGQQTIFFTLDELDDLHDQLQDASCAAKGNEKQKILRMSHKVSEILGCNIEPEQLAPPRSCLSPPSPTVYQIKILLKELEPTVWRRICVDDCSLELLHWYVQVAMGWESVHPYAFMIGGTEFVDFSVGFDTYERRDVCITRLSDVMPIQNRRPRFLYEYDFGDSWIHQLIVEERLAADREVTYPICLEGERACPPEDCGGPWGYANLLEAVRNADHGEHEEILEWVGEEFDPEKYDVTAANTELQSVRRE